MGYRFVGPIKSAVAPLRQGGHLSELAAKRAAIRAVTGKHVTDESLIKHLFAALQRDGWRVEIEL